jgi:hypothetical protein
MAEPRYAWDVFLPAQDLPLRITTDYVLSEGELLSVNGRSLLVERVDAVEEDDRGVVPVVHVTEPREPAV